MSSDTKRAIRDRVEACRAAPRGAARTPGRQRDRKQERILESRDEEDVERLETRAGSCACAARPSGSPRRPSRSHLLRAKLNVRRAPHASTSTAHDHETRREARVVREPRHVSDRQDRPEAIDPRVLARHHRRPENRPKKTRGGGGTFSPRGQKPGGVFPGPPPPKTPPQSRFIGRGARGEFGFKARRGKNNFFKTFLSLV